MAERWYKEAVIYSLQVDLFADGDRDGVGDLRGLIAKPDGSALIATERRGPPADAEAMGREAGDELKRRGGPRFFT